MYTIVEYFRLKSFYSEHVRVYTHSRHAGRRGWRHVEETVITFWHEMVDGRVWVRKEKCRSPKTKTYLEAQTGSQTSSRRPNSKYINLFWTITRHNDAAITKRFSAYILEKPLIQSYLECFNWSWQLILRSYVHFTFAKYMYLFGSTGNRNPENRTGLLTL